MSTQLTLDALMANLESPMEKSASSKPAATSVNAEAELKSVLTKQAGVSANMATAQQKGALMAEMVLGMLKQAGDQANLVQDAQDEQVAQQNDDTELTPEGDVNEILKGLLARGAENGAVDPDGLTDSVVGGDVESGEGEPGGDEDGVDPIDADEDFIIPDDRDGDDSDEEVEKTAALVALVQNGYDFADAVDLVKQASEEIEAEQEEQVKLAAVNKLMAEGIDLESAVALVKEASAQKLLTSGGTSGKVRRGFAAAKGAVKDFAARVGGAEARKAGSAAKRATNLASRSAAKGNLVSAEKYGKKATSLHQRAATAQKGTNRARAYTAAGLAALAAGGTAYKMREKKAAFDRLTAAGLDAESAVNIIQVLSDEA